MSEEISLSEELRRAREARDESLEQVHQRTGIALTILRELESGDYTVVEPVYARLAINHYASHLGLDGHAFETRLRNEVAATRPPPVEMRATPHVAGQPRLPTPQAPSAVAEFIRSQPPSRLATIGVLLVVGLAILLYLLGSDAPDPRPAAARSTKAPPPVTAAPDRPIQAGVEARAQPAAVAVAAAVPQDRPSTSSSPNRQVVSASAGASVPAARAPEAVAPVSSRPGTVAETQAPETQAPETQAPVAQAPVAQAVEGQQPVVPTPATSVAQAAGALAATLLDTSSQDAPTSATDTVPAQNTTLDVPAAQSPAALSQDVAASAAPLQLQVDALDSTWVQVQWDDDDGVVEIIPSGERRTWGAERFFMVRAGRAHGVHFRFQGQLLGNGRLGDPTKVLRFRASADGVQLLGPDLDPIDGIDPGAAPDATPVRATPSAAPQPDIVEAAVQEGP